MEMVIIMNGKKVAEEMKTRLKKKLKLLEEKPSLSVILVGSDKASEIYVKMKEKACNEVGIKFNLYRFPKNVQEDELIDFIDRLNKKPDVNGIIVQMPVPEHINTAHIFETIDPLKDVDCFHPLNRWKLLVGLEDIAPCTPVAVLEILKKYSIEVSGKNIVVVGRSYLVGQPLAIMLLNRNATVTICHSKTKNLAEHTKKADIIISAVGKPNLIKGDMISKNTVIIDVGASHVNEKITGDVDFKSVEKKASYITKVPGGVGPVTVATVLWNTFKCYKNQE
jgi:methylenetetrahydrofolate dehydrogenase (NADP+)/methenyltetrahydrofolate cyclohydrolase